jgi:hypothetical protein
VNIRPYTDTLRAQKSMPQWVKAYDSRYGGIRVVEFQCQVTPTRLLVVQFWGDGNHRVSFYESGSMRTPPTDFTDTASMLSAIAVETTRVPPPKS